MATVTPRPVPSPNAQSRSMRPQGAARSRCRRSGPRNGSLQAGRSSVTIRPHGQGNGQHPGDFGVVRLAAQYRLGGTVPISCLGVVHETKDRLRQSTRKWRRNSKSRVVPATLRRAARPDNKIFPGSLRVTPTSFMPAPPASAARCWPASRRSRANPWRLHTRRRR